ncbi:MAG TPA: serine/threonine-protein kinase, partial [Myxococcales bacterium]|nr:serine/threonine-protein kinase [Myxococcales bacterium]
GVIVALKMLPHAPDPSSTRRLRREFDALKHLDHPNIVRVLDVGEMDGIPWLSMEYVDGMALREWLVVAGRPKLLEPEPDADAPEGVDLDVLFEEPDSGALLAAARAHRFRIETGLEAMLTDEEQIEQNNPDRLHALCEALAQVCDGLSFIHTRGLLHRDVKPGNVLVRQDRRATLVDFGLAKRMTDAEITDHGHVVGTYRYMSPEQARGEPLDRRSDLYSLGATLYELLAGRAPFTHRNQFELLEAIIYQEPPEIGRINPGAPAALARLAERLLQKSAEERPQNAAEVALLLRVIGRGVWGFSEPLLVPRPAEEKTG